MKILLTGATGFIGQQFALMHSDCRCVVRKGEGCEFEDKFIVDSINANTNWYECFDGVDAIVHLAGIAHKIGISRGDYVNVNTQGTLRLASEAAKFGVKRIVFVSTIGVNGLLTQVERFAPDSIPNPHNDYAQSKYYAELGLKKIAEKTGLEVVIVRPTLVYGPSAPGNFGLLTKLVNKAPFLPFGMAKNRRGFIAVQNLADLLVTCATHPNAAGHTFLASDGKMVSTKQLTNTIAEGLGKKVIQLPLPVSIMRFAGKLTGKSTMIEQLYGNLEVDSSNIKEVLGWTPPLTMKQAMATLCDSGVNSK
ncbi:NAD-dependent epimerase/dehydratase family protein [Vibrio intestinalis]|uniref:NAD-dependent epimerase/dehydratase family protein n=1 Tax=Vibrio intestinalis TaxID=2933291 RepID=UPI0021A81077|nr:NAD-dependent epimerase/dehydratase family protein [Vibrio intestinalis]